MKWRALAVLLPAALAVISVLALVRARLIDFAVTLPADLDIIVILLGIGLSTMAAVNLAVREGQAHMRQESIRQAREEALAEHRRFLRRLDHELKNPLMAVRAGLANLSDAPDSASLPTIVAGIEAQIGRINRLVADLRKLAELETAPLELSSIDIAELLEEVLALLRERPEAHARVLVLGLPKAPQALPPFTGDRDLLLLALYNLLDNGLKYSRPGDTLKLQAFEQNDTLVIEVVDTGRGIPADEIPLVHEELYRGRGAEGISGTGVGLALASAIIERHHGQIDIHSELGRGTTVTLTLPLAQRAGLSVSFL